MELVKVIIDGEEKLVDKETFVFEKKVVEKKVVEDKEEVEAPVVRRGRPKKEV